MFTKEDLVKARSEKNVCVVRDIFQTNVKWKDVSLVYDKASENDLRHVSYGSLVINNTQNYTDQYNEIVETLSKIHGGSLAGINSIIHFFTRNVNELNDTVGLSMKEKFTNRNPHKEPEVSPSYEELAPIIHVDAADGFFIQNEGSTLWKIYRDEGISDYTLSAGDAIYIPKYTVHSVESLDPRHSASIVFKDAQLVLCNYCKQQNNLTSRG